LVGLNLIKSLPNLRLFGEKTRFFEESDDRIQQSELKINFYANSELKHILSSGY
jgi:hypothetical protein